MCTYTTEKFAIRGAGKAPSGLGSAGSDGGPGAGGPPAGWVPLAEAMVYFDHPVSAPATHALNIDFLAPAAGPAARLAVELDAGSAKALADAILAALQAAAPLAPEAAEALAG
jgi:hypothetical protein